MLAVHVDVAVLSDKVEDFLAATRLNAEASRQEPGVLRFDVVQDRADATHIVLVEVYRDEDAPGAHKQTAHYAAWRATVEPWMARPRSALTYTPISPDDADGWAS